MTLSEGDIGLRRAIASALDAGSRTFVVNLQDVSAIDSFGVAELASSHTSVARRGGRLKICNLSQKLKEVLVMTRLRAVFEAYETEADAIASCQAARLNP